MFSSERQRPRSSLACETCRKRKTRCLVLQDDGKTPVRLPDIENRKCQRCISLNLTCSFELAFAEETFAESSYTARHASNNANPHPYNGSRSMEQLQDPWFAVSQQFRDPLARAHSAPSFMYMQPQHSDIHEPSIFVQPPAAEPHHHSHQPDTVYPNPDTFEIFDSLVMSSGQSSFYNPDFVQGSSRDHNDPHSSAEEARNTQFQPRRR